MREKLPPTGELEQDVLRAHTHCDTHARELLASERCGCFYCLAVFPPSQIRDWITWAQDETSIEDRPATERDTALCPSCGIDAVIGSSSGYPIERDFLDRMRRHWF